MTNKIEFTQVSKYPFNSRIVSSLSVYGSSVPIITRPIMRQNMLWSSVTSIRFWREDD